MAKDSGIQWTTHTFNPWWGCEKVSEACKHCYAESFAKRVGEKVWGGDNSPRRFFGDKHWNEPLSWNRAAAKAGERHRVFCASMADVFEDRRDLDAGRARLWALIEATPALDWLLLSKRWGMADIEGMVPAAWRGGWPANVWAGATVENQARAEERIPALLRVPAVVRFLSMEPLLGPVDVTRYMWPVHAHWPAKYTSPEEAIAEGARVEYKRRGFVLAGSAFVDWLIIGGESGPKARPFDLAWARSLLAQADRAGVAVFMKQLGARPCESVYSRGASVMALGVESRVFQHTANVSLDDSHGGDESEWPTDLRVREFPRVPS